MAFLSKSDLLPYILVDELDEITRGDDTLVLSAIMSAEAEARMYLYDSFDVDQVFATSGSGRHQLLVNLVADIAIYLLVSRVQAGQDVEDRKARYDRALKFLRAAAKTDEYADLPRRETTVQKHIGFGSNPKRCNYY